jgi:hypothetical protein
MLKLWPFAKKQIPAAAPASAATPIKQQAMRYLGATLTVLSREKVPVASPAHGAPARGARFLEIPIILDSRHVGPLAMRKALSENTLRAIQAAARVERVNAWQVKNTLVFQYQLDRELWKYYRRADLPAADAIGLGVGRRLVQFDLDNKNTLVAGETRSGKSVTIESAMFAVMTSYTPAEAGLVVIDPNRTFGVRKDGLKAAHIGAFTNAAHLLRPIAYEAQEIENNLNYVYLEWKQRRANGIQDAPAVVLVIDELMHEAVIGDKEAGRCHEEHLFKLSQIASQGLKNNIFLVVGAHTPKISNTSAVLMRSLTRRFIGQVTDRDASRSLAGREGVNAHLLTGCGEFVEVREGDITLTRFQVAEPTTLDFEGLERRPVVATPVGPVEIINPPAYSNGLDDSFLDFPEPSQGGNKPVEIDMRTLAIYFHEKKLSLTDADQRYGLKRRVHETYRAAASELVDEVNWLQSGQPSRSPYYLNRRNA